MSSIRRIVIVGAGAVGGAIGGLLAHAGKETLMVARSTHGMAIQQNGLRLIMPDEQLTIRPPVVESIESVQWRSGDIILLATKLNDARQAIQQIVNSGGQNVPLVCATNGIQAEAWARDMVTDSLSCLVWMPALFLVPGEIRLYTKNVRGVLDLGATKSAEPKQTQLGKDLTHWLRAAGFDSEFQPDIDRWKRGKWISNLANAAQALISDDWKSIAKIARDEGQNVLSVAQLDFAAHEELIQRCVNIQLADIDRQPRPGGSTWQSLQRDKPLETEWIEGAMARLGDQFSVQTPMLKLLTKLAKTRSTTTAQEALAQYHASAKN